MKKILINSLILIVAFFTFSFDTTIDFEMNKAFFAVRNGISFYKGKPINGTVEYHFNNGAISSRQRFKNGIAHGVFETYNKITLKLTKRIVYENGKLNGESFEYYSDGKTIRIRENYKNGIKNGLYELYDLGHIIKRHTYENGTLVKQNDYSTSTFKISVKSELINGTRFTEEYYNYEDAHLWKRYKSDKLGLQGLDEIFHDNGNLQSKVNFKNNLEEGIMESYFENGKLESKGVYVLGKKMGDWQSYYQNGNLEEKGTYHLDKKKGIWEYYNENGTLQRKAKYAGLEVKNPGFEEEEEGETLN